jgi:integrase/recombinase XerD
MWIRESFAKGKNDNHLFLSDRGCRISETAIDTIVHKYTKAAIGKPLSPHKLRAGFCSVLYEQTGDIEFVRRAVGHSSAATTQRYIVTNGDERKRASEIIGNLI